MKFIIRGGMPLSGAVKLAGSKNAATKLILATLLTEDPCTLTHFPDIGDTEITAELCRAVGSTVTISHGIAAIHTPQITTSRVLELSRRNRIPIIAMGPLLARTGEAEVPILGGDKIGPRPVNWHVKALETLGAHVTTTEKSYIAKAPDGLHGGKIVLEYPSVGATETSILAAVLAKGETVILGAALEPEVMNLVKMLQKMGALIELGASRDIYIEGVSKLNGVSHEVMPDRNEAVSFACLAIATGGKIFVEGAIQDHLITFLNVVRRLGATYEVGPEGIIFEGHGEFHPLYITTAPHPGFMTDWQQPLAVLLTRAHGASIIHETIYEDRFAYAKDLELLGATISLSTECPDHSPCRFQGKNFLHVASLTGPTELVSNEKTLHVRDLRSGMIDVIAALVSSGETIIEGVEEIDRGYEKIDQRLKVLGADIERIHI